MKVLSVYSIRPGCMKEAVGRFLAGQGTPVSGVKLLGRWHKTDGSGGFSLSETDNPALLYEFSSAWSDVLDIHSSLVIEDAEAGPVLAKLYGK